MRFYKRSLLIALALTAAFLWAKHMYSRCCHTDSGLQQIIDQGGAGTLYMGSSMFRQGLDIQTLMEHEPNPFILSYNGNQPYAEYLELKYLLDHGCKIERLVVDLYVYSAAQEPWLNDNRLLYDSDWQLKRELWVEIAKSPYAGFSTAWEMFFTANNELFTFGPIYYRLVRSRYCRGGTTATEGGTTAEALALTSTPQADSSKLDKRQTEGLRGIVDLCRKSGIELFFLETPKYAVLAESEEYTALMNQYIRKLVNSGVVCLVSESTYNSCQKETDLPDQIVSFYSFENNIAAYFSDYVHMSYEGRKLFTEAISALLNSRSVSVSQDR